MKFVIGKPKTAALSLGLGRGGILDEVDALPGRCYFDQEL
jgi:hypothetical protein